MPLGASQSQAKLYSYYFATLVALHPQDHRGDNHHPFKCHSFPHQCRAIIETKRKVFETSQRLLVFQQRFDGNA